MKKNCILIIILFAVLMKNVSAALPTGALPFDVNVPSLSGGPTVGLIGINWETGATEYDFALTFPCCLCDNEQLFLRDGGLIHNISPDSRWNFKVTLGYIFPCSGSDITLGYLNFHQNNNRCLALNSCICRIHPTLSDKWPASGTVVLIDPILGIRALTVTGHPNLVSVNTVINHDVLDFDYGQSINIGSQLRFKLYGGIRYATLRNRLDVIHKLSKNFPPIDMVDVIKPFKGVIVEEIAEFSEEVSQSSYYEGAGPHFGTHFNYYLCWGFGLVGDVSMSLLAGNTNSNLAANFIRSTSAVIIQSDIPSLPVGQLIRNIESERDAVKIGSQQKVATNIDARLGIDWSYQYCKCTHSKLNIEIGYMVSQYLNLLDRVSESSIHSPELRSFHKINEEFHGFYAGFQFNF
jgi:hypothetical protein